MDFDEDFPENMRSGGHGELVMNITSPSNIQADATKVLSLVILCIHLNSVVPDVVCFFR